MKEEKAKILYNFEDDIFLARPLERDYDSSFQIGNFIFDLDKNNNVRGIELINASKLFGISKAFLKDMVSGKLEIVVSEKYIQINIQIKTKVRNADNTSSLSIERIRPDFINPTELHLALA
jgi:hypothetical protein